MEAKKGNPTTVDEYIAGYPEEVQRILSRIRAVIKEAAPGAEEKISYGMVGVFLNGGLVWFGAYKHHIGMYPTSTEMEAAIAGLPAYKGEKATLRFPLDKPVPYDLISEVVKFRVAEQQKG